METMRRASGTGPARFVRQPSRWSPEGLQALYPGVVGWVLFGAVFGLLAQALADLAHQRLGPEPAAARPAPRERTRIVILGGGFAGVATAEHLEHAFGAD